MQTNVNKLRKFIANRYVNGFGRTMNDAGMPINSYLCKKYHAMKRFLLCLAALPAVAAAFEGPTMGWSSWNTYRVNISDSLIMRQADELVKSGLDSVGYRFVNIDDGFFGGRDKATGRLLFHPARFPDGLKPVVEHIHSLGLRAGIYSDAGRNTCGNYWDKDSIACGVGLYGHEEEDCNLYFNELGFDFIKVDFCGGDEKQNTDRLSLDPESRYRSIRRSIDATGRRDVRLNVCRWNYPGTWVGEVASSWRISPDIQESWESVKGIIAQNLYLSAYAGGGRYNDMDMLELGRGLSAEEERTHFGMWCMMSSPLLIGCDLTSLAPSTLSLLKNRELIAVNQDTLGLQAYVAKHDRGAYVLVKDVEMPHSLMRAVAFYNPTDNERTLTLDFGSIDLGGSVEARNLFDGSAARYSGEMTVRVKPHDTEIFRLMADRRLVRTLYEAETAFLPAYQELENELTAGTAYYEADERCSGGVKVTNAGGQGNDVVFNDVYVPQPCRASLMIRCRSAGSNRMSVLVNGAVAETAELQGKDVFGDVVSEVRLEGGGNEIRLQSELSLEVDYIELQMSE